MVLIYMASSTGRRAPATERSVSPVIGVVLLVAVVIGLAAVAGLFFVSAGQDGVDSAVVHTQISYDAGTNEDGDYFYLRSTAVSDGDTDLVVSINGVEVTTWKGREDLRIQCVYPNDRITLTSRSENGESTVLVDEFYVESATTCTQYNTFPEKFKHAIVNGEEFVINDRYAFGLSIVPNGDDVAYDGSGDEDRQLGNISLANEWHHVQLSTDQRIEGFEPPVFVIVLVDNVHWEDAPHPDHHAAVNDTVYYDWDDPPPDITLGADSYRIEDGEVNPRTGLNSTEPTDDVFMVFKPGCERSELKFIGQDAGYGSQIYRNDELIVSDTSKFEYDPDEEGPTFDAPGVDCPGGIEW